MFKKLLQRLLLVNTATLIERRQKIIDRVNAQYRQGLERNVRVMKQDMAACDEVIKEANVQKQTALAEKREAEKALDALL